jgi:O-antigen/teichoic acid export membrane protein
MIRKTYEYIVADYLLRNSAILAVGGIAVGAINYVFQVLAARMLTVEEYGIMGAFYALFYTLAFASQPIALFTTKNVALAKDDAQRGAVLRHNLRFFGTITLIAFTLYLLCTPLLMHWLHVNSLLLIIIVGLVLAVTFLNAIINGFGYGIEDFLQPTISSLTSTLLKLIIGIGLIMLGFSVPGAFTGILLGTIVGVAYLLVIYRKFLLGPMARAASIEHCEFFWYFVVFSLSILFINIDVLLVRYFFSAYDSGLYAALSLLGKIVLFIAGAAVPVMFPRAVKHLEEGDDAGARGFFGKTMGLAGLVGGAIVLVYAVVPHLVVGMLYGTKYPIDGLVVYAGLEVLLYVLLSVVVMMALAMRRHRVLVALVLGLAVQVGGIAWQHLQLFDAVLWSIGGIAVSLALSLLLVLKPRDQHHAQRHRRDVPQDA